MMNPVYTDTVITDISGEPNHKLYARNTKKKKKKIRKNHDKKNPARQQHARAAVCVYDGFFHIFFFAPPPVSSSYFYDILYNPLNIYLLSVHSRNNSIRINQTWGPSLSFPLTFSLSLSRRISHPLAVSPSNVYKKK